MRRLFTAVVVVAFLAAAATVAWRQFGDKAARLLPDECRATVNSLDARVNPEQARNAALIAAISVKRGLPARAATIALATAYQESKLYNLNYGDRDSLGLFQQRPSQGWGTAKQITDETYATNAFYDALVRVKGYETMEITVAAQKVQRSAFPDAYADHEPGARALASALTGQSPAAFSCRFGSFKAGSATTVRAKLVRTFGTHAGTPVITGRAVTLTPANAATGWAIAQWTVAYANRLGVTSVKYDGRVWSGKEQWTGASANAKSPGPLVLTVTP
ncbi:hypothetical protein [Nocardioides sp.]|uniref:hypothetical protein n=1 Tax=Nocardioides sp. TaxID=35761 RepID=UPI0026069F94|nr:hypothetical protein [Nocardioides sp.]